MKHHAIVLAALLTLFLASAANLDVRHSAAATSSQPRALHGTLTLFDFGSFTTGPEGKKVVDAYQRMHPGVTLKFIPLPSGDPCVYEENVLAAGAAADIVVPCYTQQVFSDLPKGYWLDLTSYLHRPDPYVPGNKHWIDLFDPTVNLQNAFEGSNYYVVSWSALDATFFYNKDIFARVGITSTPTTWAQLLADSQRLQKVGYIPEAFPLGDPYPIAENGSFVSWLENQVMTKTFQTLDRDHNGIVDIKELVYGIKHRIYSPMNPDYQEAWKLFKAWSRYWEANPASVKPATPGVPGPLQVFLQGRAAMQYGAAVVATGLQQARVKFHWGVFKMPQMTPASSRFATLTPKGVGIWGAWNANAFAIPVTTQKHGNLALALDFLQWASVPRNEIPVSQEFGLLPIAAGYKPADPFHALFDDLIKHPSMQFAAEATLGPEWLKDRIATQQAYMTGQESLQQAMADMQRYTDQAAARMIKIYHLNV